MRKYSIRYMCFIPVESEQKEKKILESKMIR